jgi:hypothetical protein
VWIPCYRGLEVRNDPSRPRIHIDGEAIIQT